MTKLKLILTAILFAFGQIFTLPALAAEWGDHDRLTGFYAGKVAAFVKPDCLPGLTCPDSENTIGGIGNGILVAQSGGYHYHANELQAYFASTLHALDALTRLKDANHLKDFHNVDFNNIQQLREVHQDLYQSCVEHLTKALGFLQAHQRRYNLPQSTHHPVFSECPY